MAKVEYYDSETYQKVESKRDYDEYTVQSGYIEDSYYRERRLVDLTVYVDYENGLLVKDVEKYERWLETLKPWESRKDRDND